MAVALPRLVEHKDLPTASALMSLRWQLGVIVGPTIGGILISTFSISVGYAVDVFTFVISLIFLSQVSSIPASKEGEKTSLAGLLEGIRYAFRRQDLLGTYLIDLAAMFFAMPTALIPFWADQLGTPWALGLLYAAGTAGSVIVTLTSGWTKNYSRHGRAIMWAAMGWGTAIAAGIELLSYSIGPLAGQMRAASMAAATSLTFSVTFGGIACVIAVGFLALILPKFRRYDAKTS